MVLDTFIHNDNTEEEYYWDDYDLKLTSKPINIHTTRHIPKMTNVSVSEYLHRNEKIKILVSRKLSVSTQTDTLVCDDTTQTTVTPTCDNSCDATSLTFPKCYFPKPKSNFNFEPFNTNIIL